MDLLDTCGQRGLPLEDLEEALKDRIESQGDLNKPSLANQAIQYALDNWLIDKTIDYCRDSRGVEVGELRWFLRALSEEESEELKQLPDIKKQIIRILRRQETERRLGMMRAEELLKRLQDKGFETQYVPIADIRVSDVFKAEEGKLVKWIRLIPEFELTEDFKQTMEELDKISLQKELRREWGRGECGEPRRFFLHLTSRSLRCHGHCWIPPFLSLHVGTVVLLYQMLQRA